MVYVLPCNFDARCHHGSRRSSTKIINIFSGARCSNRCSGSFWDGGFFGMFGKGFGLSLGLCLGFGLFSSFLGGLGKNNNGYTPGTGSCNCRCGGRNGNYSSIFGNGGYVPGSHVGSVTGAENTGAGTGTGTSVTDAGNTGAGTGTGTSVTDTGNTGAGTGTSATDTGKIAGTTGEGDDARYKLDDLTEDLTLEEAKEARANFWKSLGLDDNNKDADKAWNNNRLALKKDKAGNVYVIYTAEDGTKTAFKYDKEKKSYTLPNGTTFNDFSKSCSDLVAHPKNINERKNVNVTQTWSANDAEITTVDFDGRDKENGNCVTVGSTFGSWILNNDDDSTAKVTKSVDNIFSEFANGDDKITFDEFIGYLSGYEADAMRATSDKSYGKNSKWHNTVDMDAKDMVKLVQIFNKYSDNGAITKDKFNSFITEMNKNNNSNILLT